MATATTTIDVDPDSDTEPDTTTSTLEARATAILEAIGLVVANTIIFAMYAGIVRLIWWAVRAGLGL